MIDSSSNSIKVSLEKINEIGECPYDVITLFEISKVPYTDEIIYLSIILKV
jgi:hypothetical protein